jgi:hypothetical protein
MSENMEPAINQSKVDERDDDDVKAKRVPDDDAGRGNTLDTKRPRLDHGSEILDLALTMDLKVGDRLEVQWEVDPKPEDEDDGNGPEHEPTIHWWGATLLEHDGRTDDGVAIRTLQYDPYPEGGFPESSQEDVIFMGRNVLINYPSQEELTFRTLTDDGSGIEYVVSSDEDVEDLVDSILTNALNKQASTFSALPRAQQALLAEKIAAKKDKLVQLVKEHMRTQRDAGINRPVTAQDAQQLLARTMMDD